MVYLSQLDEICLIVDSKLLISFTFRDKQGHKLRAWREDARHHDQERDEGRRGGRQGLSGRRIRTFNDLNILYFNFEICVKM